MRKPLPGQRVLTLVVVTCQKVTIWRRRESNAVADSCNDQASNDLEKGALPSSASGPCSRTTDCLSTAVDVTSNASLRTSQTRGRKSRRIFARVSSFSLTPPLRTALGKGGCYEQRGRPAT